MTLSCLFQVLIQPSARRAYTRPEYEAAGVVFTDDVSEADCIVGESPSLIPKPGLAFHCLQYGKAGRAWYLFSREDGIIDKWSKNSEQKSKISHIVQRCTSSTLGVYNSCPLLARYMW